MWRGRRECLVDGVRGAPTAFPFRAGLTRRAPGLGRFRSAGLLFNCQVAGSRGCVCGLELNVNICPGQGWTLRPFGEREDRERFHANARKERMREQGALPQIAAAIRGSGSAELTRGGQRPLLMFLTHWPPKPDTTKYGAAPSVTS